MWYDVSPYHWRLSVGGISKERWMSAMSTAVFAENDLEEEGQ